MSNEENKLICPIGNFTMKLEFIKEDGVTQVIWRREQEEEENCMSPIELKRYQNKIDNHNF